MDCSCINVEGGRYPLDSWDCYGSSEKMLTGALHFPIWNHHCSWSFRCEFTQLYVFVIEEEPQLLLLRPVCFLLAFTVCSTVCAQMSLNRSCQPKLQYRNTFPLILKCSYMMYWLLDLFINEFQETKNFLQCNPNFKKCLLYKALMFYHGHWELKAYCNRR